MAACTLVESGNNRLRYLIVPTGTFTETVTITSTGAASPDLITDSLAGPIKNMSKVFTQGYGQFASGVQTQAKSRALWLSDWGGASPGAAGANSQLPTAICRLTARSGVSSVAGDPGAVDANIDGDGVPTILAQVHGGATCYLDIEIPGAIGD